MNVDTAERLILVVEDESIVRRVISRKLSRLGHHVLEAASGEEALIHLRERADPPALVITDVEMPDMGGKALVGKIREAAPGARVLFMSGYPRENLLGRGILSDSDSFIEKIDVHSRLPAVVENMLRA